MVRDSSFVSLPFMLTTHLYFLPGGVDAPIDVADLKANTVYGEFVGGDTDETIMNFWSVVEEFDKDERSKLVKFVRLSSFPDIYSIF